MGGRVQSSQPKVCRAKAVAISTDKGWFYLGCHNCSTKLVRNQGDHWCPACRVQIAEPVPRYLLRLEVEDPTGSAFFVVMDDEVQKRVDLPAPDVVASGEDEGLATVKPSFEPLGSPFHYLFCCIIIKIHIGLQTMA